MTELKKTGGIKEFLSKTFFILYPAAAIFYYELVFKFSTTIAPYGKNLIFLLLNSIFLGFIISLLSSFLKPLVNRIVRFALLFIFMLPYTVEYFVYRQFKIFYDLKTVTGGAAGAVGGFGSTIASLVFSASGLAHIALFLIPSVLYLIAGVILKKDPASAISIKSKIVILAGAIVCLVMNIGLIRYSTTYSPSYTTQYSFQTAVNNFGLGTGLRLEIQNFNKKETISFNSTAPVPDATASENTEAESFSSSESSSESATLSYGDVAVTEPTYNETFGIQSDATGKNTFDNDPDVYGYNMMDIDFDSLKSGTNDDTLIAMDEYVSSLTPSSKNEFTGLFAGKNLVFVSAEAFSAEVIDEERTPTLYRLATKGINFTDYYQPASAGTTGGETENLLGMMPTDGGMSLKDVAEYNNYLTIGSQLNRLGYYGKAYHNNDYTFYDRNITHNNLGYYDGYMGMGNGMEQYVSKAWPESDREMLDGTIPEYINKQPFNVYYMSVSGHSDYDAGTNDMAFRHEDVVADLDCSDRVKGYLAANMELEYAMQDLVAALEEAGIADNTVIVISADHFPYGLDDDASLGNMKYLSELYGENVETALYRDHNRLIIWSGSLESLEEPIVVDSPVSSIDVLPTLSNLFGVEWDSRLLPGRDVFSDAEALVFNLDYAWKTDLGAYSASSQTFWPKDGVEVPEGYVDRINSIVANKITYCKGYYSVDYFAHIFGENVSAQESFGTLGMTLAADGTNWYDSYDPNENSTTSSTTSDEE